MSVTIREYDDLVMEERILASKFSHIKTELLQVRRELKILRLRDNPLHRVSSEEERKKGRAGGKDLGILVVQEVEI